MTVPYAPRRAATSQRLAIRGLDYHLTLWGDPLTTQRPLLFMMHGYMDVGASFQFVVDAMTDQRCVIAPDWRGFGGTQAPRATDSYWFPDYLGDLDALLQALSPDKPVDLLGHSMGGNVVMTYAGVRPARVRRLINLEGFGLPDAKPSDAAGRMARWLDQLQKPALLKPYADRAAVADRLMRNNPRLAADKALWLAGHWAQQRDDGPWQLRADAAHKRLNPVPYRAAEAIATWSQIAAPLLWVEGQGSRPDDYWGGRYSHAEFRQRLAHVPQVTSVTLADAGHMLHHDQPQALADVLQPFLSMA